MQFQVETYRKMKSIQNERMVFIFDECHRSQFGDTHKNIVNYFTNIQLFGFTGTPILAENADGKNNSKLCLENVCINM
jgi:type I restriction enzyme R subunit